MYVYKYVDRYIYSYVYVYVYIYIYLCICIYLYARDVREQKGGSRRDTM